jgi:hypothetical protein
VTKPPDITYDAWVHASVFAVPTIGFLGHVLQQVLTAGRAGWLPEHAAESVDRQDDHRRGAFVAPRKTARLKERRAQKRGFGVG